MLERKNKLLLSGALLLLFPLCTYLAVIFPLPSYIVPPLSMAASKKTALLFLCLALVGVAAIGTHDSGEDASSARSPTFSLFLLICISNIKYSSFCDFVLLEL